MDSELADTSSAGDAWDVAADETSGMSSLSKPATIYDVAKLAGVSHQTVSRFIKGYQGIRPATREKVVSALDQLGYRPNLTARSLKSGRSHRIAALTHEINQIGPSRIVQGASMAARQAGYLLDIIALDMGDPAAIQEALDLAAQLDVAGVLALASTDEMAEAFQHTDFRVPVVFAAEVERLRGGTSERADVRGLSGSDHPPSASGARTNSPHRRPDNVVRGAKPHPGLRIDAARQRASRRGQSERRLVSIVWLPSDSGRPPPVRCDCRGGVQRPDGARCDSRADRSGAQSSR